MSGHDVLVVLPTGAGKSAIYQVPALLLDGPTLVVSPLIALQHDQLKGIADTRAPEAVAVNSAQRRKDAESYAHEQLCPRCVTGLGGDGLAARSPNLQSLRRRSDRP